MGFSEKLQYAHSQAQDAKDHIQGSIDEIKDKITEKVDPLKEKATAVADAYRGVKTGAKEIVGRVKDTAMLARDKAAATRVDIEEAKNDLQFAEFLSKSGKDLDWDAEQWQVREAYVQYERTKHVTDKIGSLFTEKLQNVVGDSPEVRSLISDHLIELANTNPSELIKLERYANAVSESQKQILEKQAEIDKLAGDFAGDSSREAMQDKLTTLKKSKSIKGRILQKIDKVGLANEYMLASESARKNYNLGSRREITAEIKQLRKGIKGIKKLEDAQTEIRNKFAFERAQLFLDSDSAKDIHSRLEAIINQKFAELSATPSLGNTKRLHKAHRALRTEFENEGSIVRTGIGKRILNDSLNSPTEIVGRSTRDLLADENYLEGEIEERVVRRLKTLVENSSNDQLSDEVDKYFKKQQFAGASPKKSAEKVWGALNQVRDRFSVTDPNRVRVDWLLRKLEFRTA